MEGRQSRTDKKLRKVLGVFEGVDNARGIGVKNLVNARMNIRV